ncbi:MAG: GTP cyclohydrolase II [Gammaproteobacteria bacterium]|nr:GTP cyclohydrolase II [Gammaproteobacteria bacterium]
MSKLTVTRKVRTRIPTDYGDFQLCYYSNTQDKKEHLALFMGELSNTEPVLARIHSECFTGDVLGSRRCDCGEQLDRSLSVISQAGSGVLVYLRQEGRGIGLLEKLRAYNLQDGGLDTVDANLELGHEADARDYSLAALILRDLGVESVQLITNNPVKIEALEKSGIDVTERVSLDIAANPDNASYLRTKAQRMNHILKIKTLET